MFDKNYFETLLVNIANGAHTVFEPCYPTSPEGITVSEEERRLREEVSDTFADVWIACRVIADSLYELTDSISRLESPTSGGQTEKTWQMSS